MALPPAWWRGFASSHDLSGETRNLERTLTRFAADTGLSRTAIAAHRAEVPRYARLSLAMGDTP